MDALRTLGAILGRILSFIVKIARLLIRLLNMKGQKAESGETQRLLNNPVVLEEAAKIAEEENLDNETITSAFMEVIDKIEDAEAVYRMVGGAKTGLDLFTVTSCLVDIADRHSKKHG